jgi:putative glutamine amidotransferase
MVWLITDCLNAEREPLYVEWVRRAGAEPRVFRLGGDVAAAAAAADALLLSGGGHVHPRRYGRPVDPRAKDHLNEARDEAEFALFAAFARAGKPILGICRGLQLANVALGGGLVQWLEPPSEEHARDDRTDAVHAVRWRADGPPMAAALAEIADVNSAHHQAIDPRRLGRGLRVAATSPAGVIEAVEAEGPAPVVAVQWHPERMTPAGHPASEAVARYVAAVVRRRRARRSRGPGDPA